MSLPLYYSRLAPFRETFRSGRPMLMYHHVRRAPSGARIKGLYVSPKLFARQLEELGGAGFQTPEYGRVGAPAAAGDNSQVFLTFDDGFVDVFENGLPLLRQHGFRSIQFLVADLLGKTNEWQQRQGDVVERLMDAGQIKEWLGAGQQIGAHTCTHPRLTQIPLAAAREEISASKKKLEDQFGIAIEHFAYPYGDWNEAIAAMVQEAGYRTACTTEPGINRMDSSFALKRFTARYPSRNLKAIWARLVGRPGVFKG